MRMLDRERQRRAGLIAVEREVTRRAEPAGAVLAPIAVRLRGRGIAGLVAAESGAPRAKIIAAAAQKPPEAESVIGERDRPVRISFARRDGIAHADDKSIAHQDFGPGLLNGPFVRDQLDSGGGRPAVAHPEPHLLVASQRDVPGR